MPGITSALEAVSKISNFITSKSSPAVAKDLENIENLGTLISTNGSITKLLSKFVIEPVLVCSTSSKNITVYDKLLQLNLDIFAAFYMQAFQILQNVYGMNSRMTLDVLSTDNTPSLSSFLTSKLGSKITESLSTLSGDVDHYAMLYSNQPFLKISTEKATKDKIVESDSNLAESLYGTLQRIFDINIYCANKKNGGHTIKIPITIKAHVIVTNIDNIIAMLKPNSVDKSFSYRLDEYRSGAISLKDLIFCSDLIKEYKNNKLKDKEGLSAILANRSTSSKLRMGQTSGIQGFEKNYNMLVVTADDKVYLDKHINGDILKENYKQMLLEEANAMTITIADDDYERINILTRDIRGLSSVGYKQLSKKKANDMSEVMELMKSLLMSKPMSF